ncbi:MAG TPA: RNA polymerase sigma factor [Pseudonocardiaceae bacterium]
MEGTEPAIEEAALVAALCAGEESSFRDVVLRYHAALVRLVRASVGSTAAAEEVATNTWRQVICDIEAFDGRSPLKVWIFGIALHQARERGAGQRRIAVPPDRDGDLAAPAVDPDRFVPDGRRWAGHWCAPPVAWTDSPAQRLIGQAAVAAVMSAIDELPTCPREVLTLRDVEGWTAAEVWALLGISEADQCALLHTGRSRVRARLEDHFGGNR